MMLTIILLAAFCVAYANSRRMARVVMTMMPLKEASTTRGIVSQALAGPAVAR